MTPLEIIAFLLVLLGLIKLAVVSRNPKKWLTFWKKKYSNTTATNIVALVLAGVVLYYLLQELTIVQIMAVAAFIALVFLIGFLPYVKELFEMAEKMLKQDNTLKKSWLVILVWLLLSLWVLWEIFLR